MNRQTITCKEFDHKELSGLKRNAPSCRIEMMDAIIKYIAVLFYGQWNQCIKEFNMDPFPIKITVKIRMINLNMSATIVVYVEELENEFEYASFPPLGDLYGYNLAAMCILRKYVSYKLKFGD